MDVSRFVEIRPAPRAVFDRLAECGERPRFYRRAGAGDWESVTWNQFGEQIRRVALGLRDRSVLPGDAVAVFGNNSVEWAAAALAIQSAGAVMVPIYASSTSDQAGYVLDHSGARFVFCDSDTTPRVAGFSDSLRLGGELWSHPDDPAEFETLLAGVSIDDPGLMLYTSGTSGNPKGVPLSHRNVGANAADWLECMAPLLEDGDIDVMWLPMSHIFGFGELCLGNTLGYTTYMATPQQVLGLLPEVRPTVFMSVPAYWEKLSMADDLAAATGNRLRLCLSGGAGLDIGVKEKFLASGMLIVEGYGLTESSPTLTLNRPGDYRFDSVGKPLPSVDIELASDGEILAKGPNIFAGYHRDPDATAQALSEDGWLRTGDLGRFTDDGFLQIIGRKKEILVTAGGKNIPPANIELRFRDDPVIEHLVVYGDGKKYLVAGVWLRSEASCASDAESRVQVSIDRVNQSLARHETIKAFRVLRAPLTVESGLLTPSLKLKRNAIYARFADDFEALYQR